MLGYRGRGPQSRSRHIADEIVIVSISDTRRKVEIHRRQDMRGGTFVECLCLVIKP